MGVCSNCFNFRKKSKKKPEPGKIRRSLRNLFRKSKKSKSTKYDAPTVKWTKKTDDKEQDISDAEMALYWSTTSRNTSTPHQRELRPASIETARPQRPVSARHQVKQHTNEGGQATKPPGSSVDKNNSTPDHLVDINNLDIDTKLSSGLTASQYRNRSNENAKRPAYISQPNPSSITSKDVTVPEPYRLKTNFISNVTQQDSDLGVVERRDHSVINMDAHRAQINAQRDSFLSSQLEFIHAVPQNKQTVYSTPVVPPLKSVCENVTHSQYSSTNLNIVRNQSAPHLFNEHSGHLGDLGGYGKVPQYYNQNDPPPKPKRTFAEVAHKVKLGRAERVSDLPNSNTIPRSTSSRNRKGCNNGPLMSIGNERTNHLNSADQNLISETKTIKSFIQSQYLDTNNKEQDKGKDNSAKEFKRHGRANRINEDNREENSNTAQQGIEINENQINTHPSNIHPRMETVHLDSRSTHDKDQQLIIGKRKDTEKEYLVEDDVKTHKNSIRLVDEITLSKVKTEEVENCEVQIDEKAENATSENQHQRDDTNEAVHQKEEFFSCEDESGNQQLGNTTSSHVSSEHLLGDNEVDTKQLERNDNNFPSESSEPYPYSNGSIKYSVKSSQEINTAISYEQQTAGYYEKGNQQTEDQNKYSFDVKSTLNESSLINEATDSDQKSETARLSSQSSIKHQQDNIARQEEVESSNLLSYEIIANTEKTKESKMSGIGDTFEDSRETENKILEQPSQQVVERLGNALTEDADVQEMGLGSILGNEASGTEIHGDRTRTQGLSSQSELQHENPQPVREVKIESAIFKSTMLTLKKIKSRAIPFEKEIQNFTELENSNKHYYIEESLRKLVYELDDMFDDLGDDMFDNVGDVKKLRDARKEVYSFIFRIFDSFDAKLKENHLRIESEQRQKL